MNKVLSTSLLYILICCLFIACDNQRSNPLEDQMEPAKPTGLKAQNQPDSILLTWNPSTYASIYEIFREPATQNDPFATSQETQFVDTNVADGVKYKYWVRGVGPRDEKGYGLVGSMSESLTKIWYESVVNINPLPIDLDKSNNWTWDLRLEYPGKSDISWEANATESWLSVNPKSGRLTPGESTQLEVRAIQLNSPCGKHGAEIIFKFSGSQAEIKASVRLFRAGYLEGRCVNIFTGQGISKVAVITDIGMAETDSNGFFTIPYEVEGNYSWTANHIDFLSSEGDISTGKCTGDIGTISLIPIPHFAGEVDSNFGFDTPWSIVLSDDEEYGFVVNRDGNFISVVDMQINREVDTIDVGKVPLGAAYADGELFVANSWDNTISIIDTFQRRVIKSIEVLCVPAYLTIHRGKLYATLQDDICGNQVAILDIDTRRIERRIAVGQFPYGVVVDPHDDVLYVSNYDGDSLSLIDLDTGIGSVILVGPNPQGVAISPDGRYVYTADAGRISRVDTRNRAVVDRFSQPDSRFGCVAVAQLPGDNGDLVYATDTAEDLVWMWHPASGKAASVRVGSDPFGIAVTQDGQKIYVCIAEGNQVQWLENR